MSHRLRATWIVEYEVGDGVVSDIETAAKAEQELLDEGEIKAPDLFGQAETVWIEVEPAVK